jgi:hypothetical protein
MRYISIKFSPNKRTGLKSQIYTSKYKTQYPSKHVAGNFIISLVAYL